jgi:hypothetical protein
MNRRSFLKRLLGAAGAVVAGPVALELAKKVAPTFESGFIIPAAEVKAYVAPPVYDLYCGSEMAEELMLRTTLALKNLTQATAKLAVQPYDKVRNNHSTPWPKQFRLGRWR